MSAKFGCSLVPYDSSFYVLSEVYHCYRPEDLADVSFLPLPGPELYTGKPGVWQSLELWRVRHDLETEQQEDVIQISNW